MVRTPSAGRRTRPSVIRSFSTALAVLMGMAKPMPALWPTLDSNHGVDADHLAVPVHQRAAGVAGIDGRVGLDGFVDLRAVGSRTGRIELMMPRVMVPARPKGLPMA